MLDIIASIKFMLFDSFKDGIAVLRAHKDFIKEFKNNFKKRQVIKKQKKVQKLSIIYGKSIVLEYFIKGRKRFDQLGKV